MSPTKETAVRNEIDRWHEAFRATSAAAISRIATEYVEQTDELRKCRDRIARLEIALQRVVDWGPFPQVPGRTPDEAPCSFAVAYGSNGERDYIRKTAAEALKGK